MKKAECIEKDFFTLQKLMPEYASIQLEVLKIHHLRGNSVHRELERPTQGAASGRGDGNQGLQIGHVHRRQDGAKCPSQTPAGSAGIPQENGFLGCFLVKNPSGLSFIRGRLRNAASGSSYPTQSHAVTG